MKDVEFMCHAFLIMLGDRLYSPVIFTLWEFTIKAVAFAIDTTLTCHG
jgi:hypothetical protein